jgi:hypothetical protein
MGELDCKGKIVRFGDKAGRRRVRGRVVDFVTQPESGYPRKCHVLQKIDFSESGSKHPIRFRVGHYMQSKAGRWIWARNTPIFHKKDLFALVTKAKNRKGFFGP